LGHTTTRHNHNGIVASYTGRFDVEPVDAVNFLLNLDSDLELIGCELTLPIIA